MKGNIILFIIGTIDLVTIIPQTKFLDYLTLKISDSLYTVLVMLFAVNLIFAVCVPPVTGSYIRDIKDAEKTAAYLKDHKDHIVYAYTAANRYGADYIFVTDTNAKTIHGGDVVHANPTYKHKFSIKKDTFGVTIGIPVQYLMNEK